MGLLKARREAQKDAADSDQRAERQEKAAREHARKAKAHRDRLKKGSDDPAADRYMIRQHDADHRIAEANARNFRNMAKQTRKMWWL